MKPLQISCRTRSTCVFKLFTIYSSNQLSLVINIPLRKAVVNIEYFFFECMEWNTDDGESQFLFLESAHVGDVAVSSLPRVLFVLVVFRTGRTS